MTPKLSNWPERADALAAELVAAGKLRSRRWRAAVEGTPRHEFVPTYFQHLDGSWHPVHGDTATDYAEWANTVYRNTALVTQLGDTGFGTRGPTSSCSAPGLVTRMLDALDIRRGHRVLEIGTGTGYNAALLCHQLGDDAVVSIDIDPDLVRTARERLDFLGHQPTLLIGDGALGHADGGPYDRIEATCAVSRIPTAWTQQLAPGGRLIADLKLTPLAGNLVVLDRYDDRLEGRFDNGYATFMQIRSPHDPIPARVRNDRDPASGMARRTTEHLTRPWEHPTLWFMLRLREGRPLHFGYALDPATLQPGNVFLEAADGAWCELDGDGNVTEGGPRRLWADIEHGIRAWRALGEPEWERFGITVSSDNTHRIWLDEPHGKTNWLVRRAGLNDGI